MFESIINEFTTDSLAVFVFQALVGEKACYQSVSSYAGQIVYLGTKVLFCIIYLSVVYICYIITMDENFCYLAMEAF